MEETSVVDVLRALATGDKHRSWPGGLLTGAEELNQKAQNGPRIAFLPFRLVRARLRGERSISAA